VTDAPSLRAVRVCARCGAPAVYYHQNAGDDLCQACGVYVAGLHHGRSTIAREQLADAIAALLELAFTHEHIAALAEGELAGVRRAAGPGVAHPADPRPWVRHLLDPIP
jgi:hypothetical protein